MVDCWFRALDWPGMESPLIGLLSSTGAEHRVASRGFPSVAHLLAPFTTHTVNVRDPIGQVCSSKITLDIRDIRKQGHLLSLSVLPHVLQEALSSGASLDESLSCFSDCLQKFAEPADQETLRTFIACIFFISSNEENPMGELSRLIQVQHTQQHATTEKSIGPAHCAVPKWTTPNTLKYYVLLYDAVRDDEQRTTQTFNQMCSTYGVDSCQLLKIGTGSSEGLPDVWLKEGQMDKLLEQGLVRALHYVEQGQQQERKEGTPPSAVSTITPSFTVLPPKSAAVSQFVSNGHRSSAENSRRLASNEDRDACVKMVETFLKDALVPHAERLMRTLNDQLADRRTIGKSLTSGMRKWFGGSSNQSISSTPTTYGAESGEMKSRRLADLAYQFGLYGFAHAQYRAVKKEFENDQAWLHHAAALELSAVALRFSAPELTARQFPIRYLEDALGYQLSNSGKHSSIMRCALNAGRTLAELGQHKDAAVLLSKVASLDSDQCVGVAQVYAARYFQEGGMIRKAAFYFVLAGNRFLKAGIPNVALECYRAALSHYFGKQWDSIEDHLCAIISSQLPEKRLAIDCASRLLRSSPWQSEVDQTRFMDNFIRTMVRFEEGTVEQRAELPVPLLRSQDARVICGERPLSSDVVVGETDITWADIRRGAFHALAGSSTAFYANSMQLVSDNETMNKDVRETPAGEHFRVLFTLENPLIIPLGLRDICLDVTDVVFVEGVPPNTQPFTMIETLSSLTLAPDERKEIELSVLPSRDVKEFRVRSIFMKLFDSEGREVAGSLPFNIRGKRLNQNLKQKWPLLDFRSHRPNGSQFYCSQAVKLKVDVSNIGHEAVTGLVMATNGTDCVHVDYGKDGDSERIDCANFMAANTSKVRIHAFGEAVNIGENLALTVNIRAPQAASERKIALLFFYRGQSGAFREWRTVVDISATPFVEVSSKIMDPVTGVIMLNVTNGIPHNSTVGMAELDILKVQAARQVINPNNGYYERTDSRVNLTPIQSREIHLDCGQSDNVCFTMTGRRWSNNNVDNFWLVDQIDYPRWPLPEPEQSEFEQPQSVRLLSVLWRSNVVDAEGFKSVAMGEVFIPCPFAESRVTIPALDAADQLDENCDIYNPVSVSCPSIEPLKHDFTSKRLCEFPFRLSIFNQDPLKRVAAVTVSFVPKVTDSVASVSQVPPDCRQLWWPDRQVTSAKIDAGHMHTFNFSIRVAQPSVYELGGAQFRVDALFPDSEVISLQSPRILAVVNSL